MPSSLKPKATENAIPNVIVGKKKDIMCLLESRLEKLNYVAIHPYSGVNGGVASRALGSPIFRFLSANKTNHSGH